MTLISPNSTFPVLQAQFYFNLISRDYEKLNLFGYNYYGGYNSGYQGYLQKASANIKLAEIDKQLQLEYLKNAAKVKNGYDLSGVVIASDDKLPIPGVTVRIKGTSIATTTNSKGYFKIKVPVNGTLAFAFIGYETQEMSTSKAANTIVRIKPASNRLNEVVVTTFGIRRQAASLGFATTIVNAGIARGLEGKVMGVTVNLSGEPGASDKVVMREIRTTPAGEPNQILNITPPKPIISRTNFNETAFFYPQLRTNEQRRNIN